MAAVSHPEYKLKWVPPNKRDEVCSAFIDVVHRENKRSSVQTSGAADSEKKTKIITATESFLAVMDPSLGHQLAAKP